MAGLYDTDIRLDESWKLTAARTGDAPTCSDLDCFVQDIRLEAITQPGELFYDREWGWGLLEFLHSEDDALTRLEMTERIKEKLRRREYILPDTIRVDVRFGGEAIYLLVTFALVEGDVDYSVNLELSRVDVEVKTID